MRVINDEACGLYGARLLIKETQQHLGPAKNRQIHTTVCVCMCVCVTNCYCYEVHVLVDSLC